MREKFSRFLNVGVLLLTALCLTAGAALATGGPGSQTDPFVTLSYLTQTATPAILEQVDQRVDAYGWELADRLVELTAQYTAQMDAVVGHEVAGGHYAASYTLITLTKGQSLKLSTGGEVLLRVGSAACVSPSDPGLVDTTAGSVLNRGKALVPNHLYMATVGGSGVRATARTTKLLVRGGYTLE